MADFLKKYCACIPHRFVVCALTSATLLVCYLNDKASFQALFAVAAKVKKHTKNESECPTVFEVDHKEPIGEEVYWDTELVRAFLQTYQTGLLVALIPAGMLADYIGAKDIVTTALVANSVLTLLAPALIRCGAVFYLPGCFIKGMCHGVLRSCGSVMLARWIPHTERAACSGVISSGSWIGWVLGYVICNACLTLTGDWQVPFFVTGALSFILVPFWWVYSSSWPAQNPHVAADEMNLLLNNVEGFKQEIRLQRPFTPWKEMMTSPPVLSLLLLICGASWMHATMTITFTTYLSEVTRLTSSMAQNIIVLADIIVVPATIFWGIVCDWIVNHRFTTRTNSRKIFGFVANVLPIPFVLSICLVGCNGLGAVVLYMLHLYCKSSLYSVVMANPVDLTPQHAGVLTGFIRCCKQIVFAFSFVVFPVIVKNLSDIGHWQTLYLINAVVMIVFSMPYLWFGSAEVQHWNYFVGRRPNAATIPSEEYTIPSEDYTIPTEEQQPA